MPQLFQIGKFLLTQGCHVIVQYTSVLPLTFGIITNYFYMINIFFSPRFNKRDAVELLQIENSCSKF